MNRKMVPRFNSSGRLTEASIESIVNRKERRRWTAMQGAKPEQFGAHLLPSKDGFTSLRSPVFLPSEVAGHIYNIGATRPNPRPAWPEKMAGMAANQARTYCHLQEAHLQNMKNISYLTHVIGVLEQKLKRQEQELTTLGTSLKEG